MRWMLLRTVAAAEVLQGKDGGGRAVDAWKGR
jgi:hypothetical protein